MQTAVEKISEWMAGQLAKVPANIKAVYVEWNFGYGPKPVKLAQMASFGFEHLSKGSFDCSNPDHLSELGDFVWEGGGDLDLSCADFPNIDWTEALKAAAAKPQVQDLARAKGLLLLAGEHDADVFDVS